MKPRKSILIAIFSVAAYSSANTLAEEIRIPVGSQGNSSIEIPKRGQTQEDVSLAYGEPERSSNNIGEPPISTWHYSQFSVYFESDKVIHAVLRH